MIDKNSRSASNIVSIHLTICMSIKCSIKKIRKKNRKNGYLFVQNFHSSHTYNTQLYSCFEILSVDFSLDSNFPPTFESIFRPFGRWALGQFQKDNT